MAPAANELDDLLQDPRFAFDDIDRGRRGSHRDQAKARLGEESGELVTRALSSASQNQHVEIRELPLGADVGRADDVLDDEQSAGRLHRFTTNAQDVDASGVIPVVQDRFHQVGIAVLWNADKEVAANGSTTA